MNRKYAFVCVTLGCAAFLTGCHATGTDVQVRDAADHAPVFGQSVGTVGPLHAGYRWAITDTDGVAHLRTKADWESLHIVVAAPGKRTQAEGDLRRNDGRWTPLSPGSSEMGRRLEARVVAGEGAPATPPTQ